MCDHAEYYINDQTFLEGLRGTYGWDGTTGLSLVTYLEMMLSPHAWGDELCLYVLSHMWGVGITLLYPSENNRQHKIRHSMFILMFILLYSILAIHITARSVSHVSRRNCSKKSPRAFESYSDCIISHPE